MEIHEVIKEIRINSKIPQKNMLKNISKSTYSKIERGAVDLKFDTLLKISERLGVTLRELLDYGVEDEAMLFRQDQNKCFDNINDIAMKTSFLNKYFPNKDIPIELMSPKELAYFCAITTVFNGYWEEVPIYSSNTIEKIVNILFSKSFYTQFDYQILMNIIMFTTYEESKKLVHLMFPIFKIDNRIRVLKNQANRAILNRISVLIYQLKYEEALEFVEFAEENIDFKEDYFLALSFEYHKNLVNRFILRNTLYIERARQVITMMRRISTQLVADTYEFELNNLSDNPSYYLNETISKCPRTAIEKI